jgi:hypothetical protein
VDVDLSGWQHPVLALQVVEDGAGLGAADILPHVELGAPHLSGLQ